MRWMIFFYFPLACLGAGWAGAWTLRSRPNLHALSLAICRTLLLVFPFCLLGACLFKPVGPDFWLYWAAPLEARRFALLCVAGLVSLRWLGEMIALQAFEWVVRGHGMERRAPSSFLAALEYERLCRRLAPPWYLAWLPRPRLCFSKATQAGHLTSGLAPRICLDASLIPMAHRDRDVWWHTVLPPPRTEAALESLRALVAHELAHFKRGDHLRSQVVILAGAILPWEWLFGETTLGRFRITSLWAFRQWARLMTWLGAPLRRWVSAERSLREALADEETENTIANGASLLRTIRALYPASLQGQPLPMRPLGPPFPCRFGLIALLATLLWAAPGRLAYLSIFGDEIMSTRLPSGWCLTTERDAKVSATFIPGPNHAGRLLVSCQRIAPCHPPQLRGVRRGLIQSLPGDCELLMTWDVHFEGQQPLTGEEACVSLTQSSLMLRNNLDLCTAYSLPPTLGPGEAHPWQRYSVTTRIQGRPQMDLLLVGYTFAIPGRYVFKPPVLTLILPSGERRPFPGQ